MKTKIDNYFFSLQKDNRELSSFVDIDKIICNVDKVQIHLNSLNYLISGSKKEFEKRVCNLFSLNKDCFLILPILIAVRDNFDSLINNFFSACELNIDIILSFFYQTNLYKLIFDGKINNFVDYVYGVEVGLDTNARKNRNGKLIEKYLSQYLHNYFCGSKYINIYEQKQLEHVVNMGNIKINYPQVNKKFDFIIINTLNKKILLIESSFYNAGGSKISETSRSYYDIFKKIEEYNSNINFLWVADGLGMKTIKKDIENKYSKNYITNIHLLPSKLEWIKQRD